MLYLPSVHKNHILIFNSRFTFKKGISRILQIPHRNKLYPPLIRSELSPRQRSFGLTLSIDHV